MSGLNHLIIGSGPAGIFASETIRRRDPEASITLLTAETNPALSPVMLSYWIRGDRSRETLFFRDRSWPEKNRVNVSSNSRVVSVDTRSKIVRLSDSRDKPFDRLLIATGASPISLPIPGREARGVASLRHSHDVETLFIGGPDVKKIVILGGGFVGLKLACHLSERSVRVIVFEKEPRLASRIFDLKASQIVEKRLREGGIEIETGVEAAEILQEGGWVTGVRMKDGRRFSCQRIVETVGVRPNTRCLVGSGIDVRGGVLVDERLETNVAGIYAAGDAALTKDWITSEWVNNAIWPAATHQGRVAGWNMTGGHQTYVPNMSLNAVHLFGLHVLAAGHPNETKQPGTDVWVEEMGETYRKIVIREGRLIGFLLAGDVTGAGFLLSLMKKRDPLSVDPLDLLNNRMTHREALLPQQGYRHGLLFRTAHE